MGMLESRPRTTPRMGEANPAESATDCTSSVIRSLGFCAKGRYTNGIGPSAIQRYLAVLATPTTSNQGAVESSVMRKRFPIGSFLGQYRLASASLTTATFGDVALSPARKTRPEAIAMFIVSK